MKPVTKKRYLKERIIHEQVWIQGRNHMADVHVLPSLKKLWSEGIETFFSCQGGPYLKIYKTGEIWYNLAYVVVLKKDAKLAVDTLVQYTPRAEKRLKMDNPELIAIRFCPSLEAMNIKILTKHTLNESRLEDVK